MVIFGLVVILHNFFSRNEIQQASLKETGSII